MTEPQNRHGLTDLITDIARAGVAQCPDRQLDSPGMAQLVAAVTTTHENHHEGALAWCRHPVCDALKAIS